MSSKKKQLRLKLKSLGLQVSGSWGNSDFVLKFSSVQSLSRVWLFATPWIAAGQASLSITNFRSPPKPMSVESVMPSDHPILCHPFLLLPSIFPNIRVFSNDSALRIRWPKYWSFSFNISPSNEHPGLISLNMFISRATTMCQSHEKCLEYTHERENHSFSLMKFTLPTHRHSERSRMQVKEVE